MFISLLILKYIYWVSETAKLSINNLINFNNKTALNSLLSLYLLATRAS